MLKTLLPFVTEKPFRCLLWFEFCFSVLENLRSFCLIETSQSSKYWLAKGISKSLNICVITQSKCRYWCYMLEFVTECHKCLLQEEASHQHADICSLWVVHIVIVMQTVELKLMQLNYFLCGNLWQLQTVKNSVPCLFGANDKQF